MDPDKALEDIRRLTAEYEASSLGIIDEDADDIACALVNSVNGLDEWLSKGGFKPKDWS